MNRRSIVITGGAGFIGSHVVRLFVNKYPDYHIINLDKLTYAGNLTNLKDIENKPNYTFVKADICDFEMMLKIFKQYHVDGVIHLAAESHVDRSIRDPFTFARTNVLGTLSLLQAARLTWEYLPEGYEDKRFYHISTDEVYGKGENVHDWLYVVDHARAIDVIFHNGKVADTYNIGGFNEWKNIDIIHVIIKTVDRLLGNPEGYSEELITYVMDHVGYGLRYVIDSTKLKNELGWEPSLQVEEGIEKTVQWYLDNQEWMENVTSGAYESYYEGIYKSK